MFAQGEDQALPSPGRPSVATCAAVAAAGNTHAPLHHGWLQACTRCAALPAQDGSGFLSADEIGVAVENCCGATPAADIQALIAQHDRNGDGVIDYAGGWRLIGVLMLRRVFHGCFPACSSRRCDVRPNGQGRLFLAPSVPDMPKQHGIGCCLGNAARKGEQCLLLGSQQ